MEGEPKPAQPVISEYQGKPIIGGQEKNKHLDKRTKGTQGRSTKTNTPVFGISQRNGIVEAEPVERVNRKTIREILKKQISPSANIITDELKSYNGLEKDFKSHSSVDHGRNEYVRGNIHTNRIESFWAILKRGIFGIYHQVSRKHLDKYVDEFEFRFNSKDIDDNKRFALMLDSCSGRLTYRALTAK